MVVRAEDWVWLRCNVVVAEDLAWLCCGVVCEKRERMEVV